MTYIFGPVCTCGNPQPWTGYGYPCPLHGYRTYTTATWTSITRVCEGRHCAHDVQCNRFVTWNG